MSIVHLGVLAPGYGGRSAPSATGGKYELSCQASHLYHSQGIRKNNGVFQLFGCLKFIVFLLTCPQFKRSLKRNK